jgi:uncharacterized membrane protein YdjX (TVP38/TMEM64 family)
MNRNLKLKLGSVYILCLGLIVYYVFSYLDFKDLSNYSFIKDKSSILINFKENNLLLFLFLFFFFIILWIMLLGFASPIAIVAGFIFGPWYGTLISVFSFSVGCTLLYTLAQLYFKEPINKFLGSKIENFKFLFNKNELLYFMIFRFIGGAGIPFPMQNILPVLFNMKIKNYFYASFFGLFPVVFILCSLGSGIENYIENNTDLNYLSILLDPGIYNPIFGFLCILITSYFLKAKLFKK